MTAPVTCPLCPFEFKVPEPVAPEGAPGIAAALGISGSALLALHAHQAAEQLEYKLTDHLERHGPRVWLPALMEARHQLADARHQIGQLRLALANRPTDHP